MIYKCTLPFPPSVNVAYGGGSGQRRFKSQKYKKWVAACPVLIPPETGCIDYPVSVSYTYYMPDKRIRDLSNYIKIPEDFLIKSCILLDDSTKIIQKNTQIYGGVSKDRSRVEIVIKNFE